MAKPFSLHVAPSGASAPDEAPMLVPEPALPARVLTVAAERTGRGIGGAMATILERHGSAPSTPGQKLWVGADGSCVGTVGGGAVEREILAALAGMVSADSTPGHAIRTFKLGAELGMCCGG